MIVRIHAHCRGGVYFVFHRDDLNPFPNLHQDLWQVDGKNTIS